MKTLLQRLINSDNSTAAQFIKSVIAGGIASFIDIVLFSLFTNQLGINHLISNTFSFLLSLVINYMLNKEWVFDQHTHSVKRDFLLFSLIGLTGLLMSNILLYVLIDLGLLYYFVPFRNDKIIKPFAKGLVIILVFIWNFVARKKFVFTV